MPFGGQPGTPGPVCICREATHWNAASASLALHLAAPPLPFGPGLFCKHNVARAGWEPLRRRHPRPELTRWARPVRPSTHCPARSLRTRGRHAAPGQSKHGSPGRRRRHRPPGPPEGRGGCGRRASSRALSAGRRPASAGSPPSRQGASLPGRPVPRAAARGQRRNRGSQRTCVGALTSAQWQSSRRTQVSRTPNSEPRLPKHSYVPMPMTPIRQTPGCPESGHLGNWILLRPVSPHLQT